MAVNCPSANILLESCGEGVGDKVCLGLVLTACLSLILPACPQRAVLGVPSLSTECSGCSNPRGP